jgi:hypothetical protein
LIFSQAKKEKFMDRAQNTGGDTYRLIVTCRNASQVLLLTRGSACFVPSVKIDPGEGRIAGQLGSELYALCGCHGYCLFVLNLGVGLPNCAVMEVFDPRDIASARICWRPLDAATCSSMESAEDRAVMEKSIEELDLAQRERNRGPFSRPGWLQDLLAWAQQQLDPPGLRLTGAFTQWNASPAFSLIRLETNDSAVWFKAARGPNRNELPVSACIARLFPAYVPELLGIHTDWNGWLTRDVPGRTLDHGTELPVWLKAAEALARLQIASIGKQAELLQGGCKDLRLPRLIEEVDPWIECIRELMAGQQKQAPARLTDPELAFLADYLKQACSLLAGLGFPDALGHLDLNPGNIVVSPTRSVFLDWAEGCVTSPLLPFEYLREHFQRACSKDTHAMGALAAAYRRPWQPLFSSNVLKKAMLLSPLVAVFTYAVGNYAWRTRESSLHPSVAGYLRSLARRMHREAVQIEERSEPCLV